MKKRYAVLFSYDADRQLSKMDRYDAKRIVAWIEKSLCGATNPRQFGKGLSGDSSEFWRYRIGKYRLIAEIRDREVIIEIIAVGHRATVYVS